jgi:hypothetical protein
LLYSLLADSSVGRAPGQLAQSCDTLLIMGAVPRLVSSETPPGTPHMVKQRLPPRA